MRPLPSVVAWLVAIVALGLAAVPALAQTIVDPFPEALPDYLTGGWQAVSPGLDPGVVVRVSSDGQAIVLDGTYYAMASRCAAVPISWISG